jgi:uncharacterized membrane protein YkgB
MSLPEACEYLCTKVKHMQNTKLFSSLQQLDVYALNFLRISIFIVMAWIGGLKAFQYEADGIVPFVANSPLMSFFYKNAGHKVLMKIRNPFPNIHCTKTLRKVVQKNIDWHKENGTYGFAYGLGLMIITIRFWCNWEYGFPKGSCWGSVDVLHVIGYAIISHNNSGSLCS